MKKFLQGLMIVVLLYIIIFSFNVNLKTVERIDKLYEENLVSGDISEIEKILLYRAEDGYGIALIKNDVWGRRVKLISKILFKDNGSWEYLEIVDSNNNIHPLIYGYIDKKNNKEISVKVKNRFDNLDEQACALVTYKKEPWILLLDAPTKNKEVYVIYDLETNKPLYDK